MDITAVQPGDETALREWWAVHDAAQRVDIPWLPSGPVEELLAEHDRNRRGSRRERWAAVVDGRMVGGVRVELPQLDNTDVLAVELVVHPAIRRRGVGRALFDHVMRRARAEHRRIVIGEVTEPLVRDVPSAGAAFATVMGARLALSELCRVLDLDTFSEGALTALRHDAAAQAGDYELVQWVGPAADDVVEDQARLQALMSTDAPLDDLEWSPEVWDADRIREEEREALAKDRVWMTTGARHIASGRLVAYTDIGVALLQPEIGYQWTTIVAKAHRGHRLGMLVKAANIPLLRARCPKVRRVVTWNAESNDHMVAINEAMGFQKVARWAEWQLAVPPPA